MKEPSPPFWKISLALIAVFSSMTLDSNNIEEALSPKENILLSSLADDDMGNKKNEATEALIALGYSASDALRAVKQVTVSEETNVEDILKASLKYLL